jgi:hypothetical protein
VLARSSSDAPALSCPSLARELLMHKKSIALGLAALLTALAPVGSARADATYLLTLSGTDEHTYPPCRLVFPHCGETVDLPWNGLLTIVIDSNADGTFGESDVTSFSFAVDPGRLVLPFSPGSITVSDGRVTSVDIFNYPTGDFQFLHFAGLSVSYFSFFDTGHFGADFATGTLTAVPEPGGAALALCALACAGAARSRRGSRAQASVNGQRGRTSKA